MIEFKKYVLMENILAADKEVRRFDALKSQMSQIEQETMVKNILEKYKDAIDEAAKKFQTLVKSETKKFRNVKFLFGTKPLKSIISKVVNRGRDFTKLGDMIRGAVLFETNDDVVKFVKDFRRKSGVHIVDYEMKEKGKDATYGYFGSHHFDLDIDGFIIELQVMTNKLWSYKTAAHDVYNNVRDSGVITKADIALSKKLFSMGNQPKFQHEDVEDDWGEYFLIED